jgi:hypothetical protein
MTLEIYGRAIRNGRRSVRSQRRVAALAERGAGGLDRVPLGTIVADGVSTA